MISEIPKPPLSTEGRIINRFVLIADRRRIAIEFASALVSPEKQRIYEEGNALCDELMQRSGLDWGAGSEKIKPILDAVEKEFPGYRKTWIMVDKIDSKIAFSGDDGEFLMTP